MDMESYVRGAAGDPPGAYLAGSEGPYTAVRNGVSRTDADAGDSRPALEDTYTPAAGRAADETAVETPGAVRGQQPAKHADHDEAHDRRVEDEARERKTTSDSTDEETERADPHALSEAEERQVEELRQRDREVRAHEQAHAAAGARNVRFEYQMGPDGRAYAIGGSADIESTAMSSDYDSRIQEARKMRASALAPVDPSAQDMAVAARATRLEAEALADKAEAEREAVYADEADEGTGADVAGGVGADGAARGFFAVA